MGEGIVTSHFGQVFIVFHFFYGGSRDRTWLATHGDTEWSVEA